MRRPRSRSNRLTATAWPATKRTGIVSATRMPACCASVIAACSTSGASIASPSPNLTTHCAPSISSRAFGRAPPIVTPGASSRRSSSGTGSPSCRLRMSSWMRAASPSTVTVPTAAADTPSPTSRRRAHRTGRRRRSTGTRATRAAAACRETNHSLAPAVGPRVVDGARRRFLVRRQELFGDQRQIFAERESPRSSHASAYRSETPRLARTRLSSPTSTGSAGTVSSQRCSWSAGR